MFDGFPFDAFSPLENGRTSSEANVNRVRVANAVEVRRREFVTARRCAREALAKLGHAPVPIRSGPMREPQWPAGMVGSITHTIGFRAAAIAPRGVLASVGIDTEHNARLPVGIEESITVSGRVGDAGRIGPRVPDDTLGPAVVQREGVALQMRLSYADCRWHLLVRSMKGDS